MQSNTTPQVEDPASRWFGPKYTPAETEILRRHVIKMANGKLESAGDFWTGPAEVEKLFTVHLPAALKEAKAKKQPLRVLFWAHGGLVAEKDALRQVLNYRKTWQDAGIYPIYFVWKTGVMDSFRGLLGRDGERGFFTDPLLEIALRVPATAVWSEIKGIAKLCSGAAGGASFAAELFKKFHAQNRDDVRCFACGHSAGSIFHSHWLPKLAAANIPVQELFLLAPAANVELFAENLQSLVGANQAIRHCSMFTMDENAERHDNVIGLYRKSLLYFVSRACEDRKEQPILGLVENLRADPGMRAFWGLDATRAAAGELVFSPNHATAGTRACNSTSHGEFDNDPDTLNSLARRMTGNVTLAPFNQSNTPRGMGTDFSDAAGPSRPHDVSRPVLPLKVKICVRHGGIEATLTKFPARAPAIGFRVVGHYEGAEPMGPERVLDCWVSGITGKDSNRHGVVAGMTRRGTMSGVLGQTTLLPHASGQFAVFLGLGKYGCLGPAELTTAVRELCLEVSQLKGRHLATVLIGGGAGNMTMTTAAAAWLRGIQQAQETPEFSLQQVTFIEFDARRYLELDEAMGRALQAYTGQALEVDPNEYSKAATAATNQAKAAADQEVGALKAAHNARIAGKAAGAKPSDSAAQNGTKPSHLTVRAERDCCFFTALTHAASVPERVIRIDPQIVDEVAHAITAATDPEELRQWGRTLQQILIPRDLYEQLFSSASPLVMTLDATMARVPWEMLVIPDRGEVARGAEQFLGLATGFGLTRQLQTTFAPVPERSQDDKQSLSVIIVSDPAEDASLPGARREAAWVKAYFSGIAGTKVVCLEGDTATRANLAKELCNHAYDILHFAGHCYFNPEQPGKSGWIFHRDPLQVFSADELLRMDRVPSFIFSNACESGVTPDRAHLANLGIGPAFAEAFFAKGVSNFVCTGWPVDDQAALAFAQTFYQELFEGADRTLRAAMMMARQTAWNISNQTAGAYQHYGNPFHTFPRKT